MQEDSRKRMAQFVKNIHFLSSHGHQVNQNESAAPVAYFNFGMAVNSRWPGAFFKPAYTGRRGRPRDAPNSMLPRGDMVPQSKKDLIAAAYDAFNRRDIDSVLALMAPDVDWPNAMEGGRAIGHDQVRAYWTKQFSVLNPRVDPVTIEPDESGRVAVHVHQVVRDLSGNVLVDHFVQHLYSFKNDLIARMDIREPDARLKGSD